MSAMLAGCVLDYYLRRLKASGQRLIAYIALGACALILAWTYVHFSPIVYGSFLKGDVMNQRKWVPSWDWTA
jgi:dolichyl-phosphate-mannose--protein O-mannosyl transferase